MTEPLVDREGYPRNDIDVYQVRHARHKIICLQNDFKALTKEIEQKLEILHQMGNGSESSPMDIGESEERRRVPIARVNLVSEGSPAYHAGLECEDLILTFGSIDCENFQSIADIGGIVQRSRGQLVNVTVKRQSALVKLALIPGEWSGRGLLGCNIVPVENIDR
jgi:26S proteasome non-ATPase regulatory subunit 9